MAEYIEREALRQEIERIYQKHFAKSREKFVQDTFKAMFKRIDDAQTIDAVPVVRCGQCRHWKTADDHCMNPAGLCATGKKARNNYCSLGERKDGDNNG